MSTSIFVQKDITFGCIASGYDDGIIRMKLFVNESIKQCTLTISGALNTTYDNFDNQWLVKIPEQYVPKTLAQSTVIAYPVGYITTASIKKGSQYLKLGSYTTSGIVSSVPSGTWLWGQITWVY